MIDPPDIGDVECPQCEAIGHLSWRWVLVAKPLGTFSLSGQQMKVSALRAVEVTCACCDLRMLGTPGASLIQVNDK